MPGIFCCFMLSESVRNTEGYTTEGGHPVLNVVHCSTQGKPPERTGRVECNSMIRVYFFYPVLDAPLWSSFPGFLVNSER